MKNNEIYTAYVSWPGGGKRRPVLILKSSNDFAKVFKITTQYVDKSESIKKHYYKINDLKQAGLKKASYIDTISKINLPKSKVKFRYIGELSINDINGLAKFVNKNK